jgi:hypothetical protein
MANIPVTLDRNKTITIKYVAAPPVQYSLSLAALAGTTAVGVSGTVDSTSFTTPKTLTLDTKGYTIVVPDQIVVSGVTYNYSTYTET